jgi:outer membrane immunogenic protein
MKYRMKNTVALLTGISLCAIAAPAFAQDSGATFTGPRVEGIIGYDIAKAGSSVDDDANQDNDQSIDGFMYGVAVGYDFDFGGAVVGADAELTTSTAKVDFDDGGFEGFGFGNVSAGRDLYLGVRAGVKAAPDVLLYAKGGYTNAKFDIRSNDGTTEFNQDIDTDGYRLGAGAEYAMSANSFVKLEYRYSNYSKAEIDFEGDIADSDPFDVDLDRHQLVASYGFRF